MVPFRATVSVLCRPVGCDCKSSWSVADEETKVRVCKSALRFDACQGKMNLFVRGLDLEN